MYYTLYLIFTSTPLLPLHYHIYITYLLHHSTSGAGDEEEHAVTLFNYLYYLAGKKATATAITTASGGAGASAGTGMCIVLLLLCRVWNGSFFTIYLLSKYRNSRTNHYSIHGTNYYTLPTTTTLHYVTIPPPQTLPQITPTPRRPRPCPGVVAPPKATPR